MIPKKLEIKNFLSHSHSIIDFDKFNCALIIGSYDNSTDESNGSGKSAILEAIRWALFDKARHRKKDGMVKRDTSVCTVIFDFFVGNQLYRITRKRNKVVSETDVVLERWGGAEFESIGCDTNTATDNKIAEIINFNHDVFLNSIYFRQGDISIFTDSTPSKRKDILKSLLKLDKWDEYQKRVKKYHSKLSTVVVEKQKRQIPLELISDEIENNEIGINRIKEELNKQNNLYDTLNEQLVGKKYEYQYLAGDQVGHQRLSELESSLVEARKRLSKIKKTVNINTKVINSGIAEIRKNKNLISACNKKIKSKKGINLDKKRAALLEGQAKEKIVKERISHLKQDIRLDKKCDSCLRPIESDKESRQIKQLRRTELKELKDKYNLIVKKLKTLISSLKNLENVVEEGSKAEIERNKLSILIISMESKVKNANDENNRLMKEVKEININGIKSQISELKSKLNKDNIDKIKEEILVDEKKLAETKKSIDKLNIELGSLVSNKKELLIKQKEQKKLDVELDKLSEELIVYDKLRQYFGKDGIQSIIIENVVDELENYTNDTLAKICNEPTSINILMQRQSDTGSWTETFDIEVNTGSRKDEFEALSGGEKFRVSLALRLAFSKILSKRMGGVVKFLLLDEVSSSLDPKGLNMFADIVKQLSNEMKILIITHDDRLKDKFEDVILVEKTNRGSRANI